MIASSLCVTPAAWHVVFMRQCSLPMESSEWETWLEAMAEGHSKVETEDLAKLRCSCTVRAVQSIFDSAPDKREQCQDAWRAVVDLLEKVCKSEWFSKCERAFQEEVSSMKATVEVGSLMHHSTLESQKVADAFKKKLQSPSKGTMHFNKVLSTSAAGMQLNTAICEVLAAQEKVSGWTADLNSAVEQLEALPQLLQDHFLNKDFDVVVPFASKVSDIQNKLGSLLQNSTDKFRSENETSFDRLKDLQQRVAVMIKTALAKRIFCKVPSLADALSWIVNGCTKGTVLDAENHLKAVQAAKSAVIVKTQFAKYVGPDFAKSLSDYIADFAKFFAVVDGFCNWLHDAEKDKQSASISCFQADAFVEWTKHFHELTKGQFVFSISDAHADGPKWVNDMKVWLSAWSEARVTTKVASCQGFVNLVFQDDMDVEKICVESVTGAVDADEEMQSIRSAIREFSGVACTVCFHQDLKADFQFGETRLDLQSLCAANIYLPAARYTTALLGDCQKVAKCNSMQVQNLTTEEIKNSGGSRTECATNLLATMKRWVQARARVDKHNMTVQISEDLIIELSI